MAAVIHTRGLRKTFGRVAALDGLDLEVARGEVHGFLGPNGAGKSTTIRVLLGLYRPSGGTVSLFGEHPWRRPAELHRRLAYVPGDVSLWPALTGGEAIDGPGYFFQPTVIDKLSPQSAFMREEIFGPVLGIIRFSTEEEAVEIANNTEYGLVSYVFTENLARGQRMIEKLETGMMGLNTGLVSNAAAPFGGLKQSGIGREGGFEGIHEFLSTKYTLIPR